MVVASEDMVVALFGLMAFSRMELCCRIGSVDVCAEMILLGMLQVAYQ